MSPILLLSSEVPGPRLNTFSLIHNRAVGRPWYSNSAFPRMLTYSLLPFTNYPILHFCPLDKMDIHLFRFYYRYSTSEGFWCYSHSGNLIHKDDTFFSMHKEYEQWRNCKHGYEKSIPASWSSKWYHWWSWSKIHFKILETFAWDAQNFL